MRIDPAVVRFLVLVPALASWGASASAVEWELGVGVEIFDNFFQAPAGTPGQDVNAWTLEGRVEGRTGRDDAWRPFLDFKSWQYENIDDPATGGELGDSQRLRAGARHARGPQRAELRLTSDFDRPTVSVGDEFDRSDRLLLTGEYSWTFAEALELGGSVEAGEESFDLSPEKESDLRSGRVFLRYRGWGSVFSPEVGWEAGERDVIDPDEDYDQDDLYVQLRSVPTPGLYLSLRWRDRRREYTTQDPGLSNFARRDDRTQIAITAWYAFNERFSMTLYGTDQDADSTKASRVFEARQLSAWLTVHF